MFTFTILADFCLLLYRHLVAAKSSATAASNAWASSAPEAAVPEQSSMATTPRDNHIIYIYIPIYIYIWLSLFGTP